jgi:hypothetical protein
MIFQEGFQFKFLIYFANISAVGYYLREIKTKKIVNLCDMHFTLSLQISINVCRCKRFP